MVRTGPDLGAWCGGPLAPAFGTISDNPVINYTRLWLVTQNGKIQEIAVETQREKQNTILNLER